MSERLVDISLEATPKKERKRTPSHFADFSPEERKAKVEELGLPGFRAKQIATHLFTHYNTDPMSWSDFPKEMRPVVAENLLPTLITKVRSMNADGGRTRKDLWRLHDGVLVESVLMEYSDRVTVCISSQAGCGMDCPFCATGQGGLTRNLSAGEITAQVVEAARVCASGELPGGVNRLSNIVFMGMGEPLMNYNNVLAAIERISAEDGLFMSPRRITVSTAGVAKQIKHLGDDKVRFKLALSPPSLPRRHFSPATCQKSARATSRLP